MGCSSVHRNTRDSMAQWWMSSIHLPNCVASKSFILIDSLTIFWWGYLRHSCCVVLSIIVTWRRCVVVVETSTWTWSGAGLMGTLCRRKRDRVQHVKENWKSSLRLLMNTIHLSTGNLHATEVERREYREKVFSRGRWQLNLWMNLKAATRSALSKTRDRKTRVDAFSREKKSEQHHQSSSSVDDFNVQQGFYHFGMKLPLEGTAES